MQDHAKGYVYNDLRLYEDQISNKTLGQLCDACTIDVPGTPDTEGYRVDLYDFVGDVLVLPRGMYRIVKETMDCTIADDRRSERDFSLGKIPAIKLRDYQEPAVQAIVKEKEGILVAPPGAGKTVMVLEAIRRTELKALIIVDKVNLLDQWSDRCEQFLGFKPGLIGGGVDDYLRSAKGPVTIAMQQTLARRGTREIEKEYGFVCLDECHHVSAETYLDVFKSFPAEYRIGVSATPTRDDGLEMISRLIIGPVIYRIVSTEARGMLPVVERVQTKFDHPFWSTHSVSASEECTVPNCKKSGTRHYHQNNYMQVVKALSESYTRNHMIADKVVQNQDCANLIVSDRLKQLDEIKEIIIGKGFDPERVFMLTGREDSKERANAIYMTAFGSCAILSTIAKEALDIPRLDRLYLAWPIKKEHILEQQIGRIVRPDPDKTDVVVYDFHDHCTVLAAQGHARLRYYRQKGYTIE